MSGFDELVLQVQQSDIKQEEERLKREQADRAAWVAKHKITGTYSASQLLEKMYGGTVDTQIPTASIPVKPEEKKPDVLARFPPPPTGKR